LAALATVGAAQAQSSVTVYGLLDMGYMALESNNAGVVRNTSAITHGQQSTSRLGFRGTEDLGGGLRANFVTELGLTPTEATFSGSTNYANGSTTTSTSAVNSSGVDNRLTTLSLAGKFGELTMGRNYTAVDRMAVSFAAGGGNALVGEVQYTAANSSNLNASSAFGRSAGATTRASNTISYVTPRINGLQMGAGMAINNLKDSAGAAVPGVTETRLYSVAADYVSGKARVAGAYAKGQLRRDVANATTAAAVNIQGTLYNLTPVAIAANSVNQTQWIVGGSYDFGVAQVMLSRMELEAGNGSPEVQASKRTSDSLGVRVPVNPKVNAFATMGKGEFQNGNTTAYNGDFKGYQLGANYNFSKRTNAYAIYGQGQTDTSATASIKEKQYAVGLRHSF